jgi:hypothetical protein
MFIIDPTMFAPHVARMPVILGSIAVVIPALNFLMFTIQNGTALMFPAWVRMGADSRGFETMGQNLLTMGATTVVAAVALVFPVGLTALVIWFGMVKLGLGLMAVLIGCTLGSILLALELWPVVVWLGSVFERTDVSEVSAAQ